MVLQTLKKLIYHSDMFCSSEMLRYNSGSQYKTLTGGLFSISIIIFIAVVFASMILNTFNRSTITASLQTIKLGDPPLSILKTNKEGMFMFGLSVQSYSQNVTFNADLGVGPRYFDFFLAVASSGYAVNTIEISMEQCTPSHWSMLPDIHSRFETLGASKWLCPPKDIEFRLQGIYSSPINSQIFLSVSPCSNSSSSSIKCAPQQQIDALMQTYQNFYVIINYINPVINPTETNYISYYNEANDFIIFSKTMGSQMWIYFSDYTINTDTSIWPIQNIVVETGSIVEQRSINHAYYVGSKTPYAVIYLAKSSNSLVYTRTVQKISAVLSYIGGLVGAMTAGLFLIKAYTDSSLEMSIGINLFNECEKKSYEGQQQQKPTFNLLKFMGLYLYELMLFFKIKNKWQGIGKLYNFRKEIVKQLDIRTLIKRIIYLQQSMMYLFDEVHLEGMKYQKPISYEKVRRYRQMLLQEAQGDSSQGQEDNINAASKSPTKNVGEITENSLNLNQFTTYPNPPIKRIAENYQGKDKVRVIALNPQGNIEDSDLSDHIPVQFIQKKGQIASHQRQSCAKRTSKQLLDERSIQNLKILHKKSKQDKRCSRIWMNLREQVQIIIQKEIQYKGLQQQEE